MEAVSHGQRRLKFVDFWEQPRRSAALKALKVPNPKP
jgi:hypothetical protein